MKKEKIFLENKSRDMKKEKKIFPLYINPIVQKANYSIS